MERKQMLKLSALAIAFILLATTVLAANEVFYLRGSSKTITVDSITYHELKGNAPASSATTTISKDISVGTNNFNSWITGEATAPFTLSGGSAFVYFSSIGVSGNATAKYRWSLYDYNSSDQSLSLIGQSDFYTLPSTQSSHETYALLPSYTFQTDHRAKLVLEYQATISGGTISAVVDESSPSDTFTYESSNGSTYTIPNIANSAVFIVNTTGSCSIACISESDCNDSNPATTDTCSSTGGCNSNCLNLSGQEITCSTNSECNDSNSLTNDSCQNAGTVSSSCTNTPIITSSLSACSSDSDCDDSNSLTSDVCSSPGQSNSSCSNNACNIRCDSASDCTDNDSTTTDSCSNPGTCNARCNYIKVEVPSCNSNSECDDGIPETSDYCFRPGASNSGCGNLDCNPACAANSDCDDGDDSTTDVCAGQGRCTASCYNLKTCGNGTIEEGETSCTCPSDAGLCGGTSGPTCTEFACIGGSCRQVVAIGCCGNKSCEFKENYSNCQIDCTPRNFELVVKGLGEGAKYLRGDTALINIGITGDGVEIKDAVVYVEGFFGKVNVYNDGRHNDGKDFDNVYGNTIPILEGYEAKKHEVKITVEFKGSKYEENGILNIDPSLGLSIATDKENYSLGDNINISGKLLKGTKPLQQNIDLNIVANGKLIIKKQVKPEADGSFSFSYHTSIVEPDTGWKISAFALDGMGNFGFAEKDLNLASSKITDYLTLSLLKEIRGIYKRDEHVDIEVKLMDEKGAVVSGAKVSTVTPLGDILELEEKDAGNYAASMSVARNFPIGMHEMKINASKIDANHVYGGSLVFDFNVEGISLNVELLEPVKSSFQLGEDVIFRAKVTYPDNEPLIAPDINAFVNGKKVIMRAVDKGLYVGSYAVDETDVKGIDFSIDVDDSFGNAGSTKITVQVSGTSFIYYVKKYFNALILAGIALAIAAAILLVNLNWKVSYQNLTRKQRQVIEKIKGTQVQYFKEGSIDRRTYDAEMQKYEAELEDTKKALAILEKKLRAKK